MEGSLGIGDSYVAAMLSNYLQHMYAKTMVDAEWRIKRSISCVHVKEDRGPPGL